MDLINQWPDAMSKKIRQHGLGWASCSSRSFNVLAGFALLVLSLAACEVLVRFSPVLKAEFDQMQEEERFLRVVKINPLWGWGFAPNIDVLRDSTGREREPMVYRFRTIPIPGHEEYGMRDDGWNPTLGKTSGVSRLRAATRERICSTSPWEAVWKRLWPTILS